jgi:hypothetical protein
VAGKVAARVADRAARVVKAADLVAGAIPVASTPARTTTTGSARSGAPAAA